MLNQPSKIGKTYFIITYATRPKKYNISHDYIKIASKLFLNENKNYKDYKSSIDKIFHLSAVNDWEDIIEIFFSYFKNIEHTELQEIVNNSFNVAADCGAKKVAYKIVENFTEFLEQTSEFTSSSFYKLLMHGDLKTISKLLEKNENIRSWLEDNKLNTIIKGNYALFENSSDKELYIQLKEAIGMAIDYYGVQEEEITRFLKEELHSGYFSAEILSEAASHMFAYTTKESELECSGETNYEEIEFSS